MKKIIFILLFILSCGSPHLGDEPESASTKRLVKVIKENQWFYYRAGVACGMKAILQSEVENKFIPADMVLETCVEDLKKYIRAGDPDWIEG